MFKVSYVGPTGEALLQSMMQAGEMLWGFSYYLLLQGSFVFFTIQNLMNSINIIWSFALLF